MYPQGVANSSSGSVTPAKQSEFDREANTLATTIDSLLSTARLLQERLDGVTRPQTPQVAEATRPVGAASPIGQYLQQSSDKVATANAILADILSRLEI